MNINETLFKYGQEHLLAFYDELSDSEKEALINDISSIDFERMQNIYDHRENHMAEDSEVSCAPYIDKEKLIGELQKKYEQLGNELISEGKLAVCSMAGGQGTRLGHTGPKGTFVVALDTPKSIFEILMDKLKEAYQKYGVYLHWYIMTSEANDCDTQNFFVKNNYFDYPKEYIHFFKQGELPLMNFEGKMLLENKGKVFKAADGNGGIFEALEKNNILEDMKEKNIQYLSIGNVDNILIRQIDALLLGMMAEGKYELASKSIVKKSPEEPVGVFCKINDRPSVIEYIDLDPEKAKMRDDNEELFFGEAFFGNTFMKRTLLEKIATAKLPIHTAKKKNSYLGENGEMVVASEPNTYKFEAFIFDAFKMADDMLILRTKREEEFAPIKNKEGADSPETARKLYMDYYAKH
ncbi:MAG: UTP--glucose-1-phosphate uridylyltransferase [Clostridia bacterium]|nr:UTP--glucose-1-phosphate uridylyltransferase [Clostridia bacterium]